MLFVLGRHLLVLCCMKKLIAQFNIQTCCDALCGVADLSALLACTNDGCRKLSNTAEMQTSRNHLTMNKHGIEAATQSIQQV